MSDSIISDWLNKMSQSVAQRDHSSYMQLFSRCMRLPGYENSAYADGSKQHRYAFVAGLIDKRHYRGLKSRATTDKHILFTTHETVTAACKVQGNKSLLEKQEDGQWRLVRLRVMRKIETRRYGLV